mgnify:CR=1 FL=1
MDIHDMDIHTYIHGNFPLLVTTQPPPDTTALVHGRWTTIYLFSNCRNNSSNTFSFLCLAFISLFSYQHRPLRGKQLRPPGLSSCDQENMNSLANTVVLSLLGASLINPCQGAWPQDQPQRLKLQEEALKDAPTYKEMWFNQTLDHFRYNGIPRKRFAQRFLLNDDHWGDKINTADQDPEGKTGCRGPILFYTGLFCVCLSKMMRYSFNFHNKFPARVNCKL